MTSGPETTPDLSIGPDMAPDLSTGPLDAGPDDPRLGSALFVDDEAHTLTGLRSDLGLSLRGWHLVFAGSGQQGLTRLHGREVDVVLSALHLTDMSGAQFLAQVQEFSPATRRLVISAETDPARLAEVAQVAQQVITMPADAPVIGEAIRVAREAKWELAGEHTGPEPVHAVSPLPPSPRADRPAHRRH